MMQAIHKGSLIVVVIGFLAQHGSQLAYAADAAATVGLVGLLRNAKIVNPSTRLDVLMGDKEVTILTKRNSKTTDNDCKINAILMAKVVMDSLPKVIRVKTLFTVEGADACDQVVLRAGDIKSYGTGALSEDQLLSSIEIERVSGEKMEGGGSKERVAAGVFKERRMMLLARIDDLKQKGAGVGPFQTRFSQIEDMVKAGNTKDLPKALDDLAQNLTDQENQRRQAQRVQAGNGGVRGALVERKAPTSISHRRVNAGDPLGGDIAFAEKEIAIRKNRGLSVVDCENRLASIVHKQQSGDIAGAKNEMILLKEKMIQEKNWQKEQKVNQQQRWQENPQKANQDHQWQQQQPRMRQRQQNQQNQGFQDQ